MNGGWKTHTKGENANHTQDIEGNSRFDKHIPPNTLLTNINHPHCVAIWPTSVSKRKDSAAENTISIAAKHKAQTSGSIEEKKTPLSNHQETEITFHGLCTNIRKQLFVIAFLPAYIVQSLLEKRENHTRHGRGRDKTWPGTTNTTKCLRRHMSNGRGSS